MMLCLFLSSSKKAIEMVWSVQTMSEMKKTNKAMPFRNLRQ